MKIKLYLDEDVPLAFAQALINRGVNAVTTQQVRNDGKSDEEQLAYATKEGRAIFTHNKGDFAFLHNEYLRNGKEHAGIILSDQQILGVKSLLLASVYHRGTEDTEKDREQIAEAR